MNMRKELLLNSISKGIHQDDMEILLYLSDSYTSMELFLDLLNSKDYNMQMRNALRRVSDSDRSKYIAHNFLDAYMKQLLPKEICLEILYNCYAYEIRPFTEEYIDNFFRKVKIAYNKYDKFSKDDLKYICSFNYISEYYDTIYDLDITKEDIDYIFQITDKGRLLTEKGLYLLIMNNYKELQKLFDMVDVRKMMSLLTLVLCSEERLEQASLYFKFIKDNKSNINKYINPLTGDLDLFHNLYLTSVFSSLLNGEISDDGYFHIVRMTKLENEQAKITDAETLHIVNLLSDNGYEKLLNNDPSKFVSIIKRINK